MNLEDFKSFRRVLKPSEVGSIPTHSRQAWKKFGFAALAGAWILMFSSVVAADDSGGPSAANRAARSAVFPAWGQLTNGKPAKAATILALETYLVSGIVIQTRRGLADRRAAEASLDEGSARVFDGLADGHDDRRRNLVFWAMITMFFGVIDAYVDGHLGDFDEEMEEGKRLFSEVDVESREVGIGWRF